MKRKNGRLTIGMKRYIGLFDLICSVQRQYSISLYACCLVFSIISSAGTIVYCRNHFNAYINLSFLLQPEWTWYSYPCHWKSLYICEAEMVTTAADIAQNKEEFKRNKAEILKHWNRNKDGPPPKFTLKRGTDYGASLHYGLERVISETFFVLAS